MNQSQDISFRFVDAPHEGVFQGSGYESATSCASLVSVNSSVSQISEVSSHNKGKGCKKRKGKKVNPCAPLENSLKLRTELAQLLKAVALYETMDAVEPSVVISATDLPYGETGFDLEMLGRRLSKSSSHECRVS
jgi:hypothetical protein